MTYSIKVDDRIIAVDLRAHDGVVEISLTIDDEPMGLIAIVSLDELLKMASGAS